MTTQKRAGSTPPQVSAADFKAHCLGIMDEVFEKGRSFTITKRGKPVARLVPYEEEPAGFLFGCMRGMISWDPDLDLTEPSGEIWDAEIQ